MQLWKMVKNGRLEVRCCAHPLLLSLSLSLSFIPIFSLSFSYTELSMIFHMLPIYLKFYEIREIVKHKKHIDSYA